MNKSENMQENKFRRLLAVYGTLKKGFGNNRLLENSTLLGEFKTEPQFTMFSNYGFPIVWPQGDTAISAEIYEVTDERVSNRINQLEGYRGIPDHQGNWYNVRFIDTPFGQSEIFVMEKRPNLPIVEDGIWKK